MSRKQLYDHFIITNWRGLASKIKEMRKKTQRKKK